MPDFQVVSKYSPSGDQPEAIASLAQGLRDGLREQVLLGVTGSGKTYAMAKVIEAVQRPTLVLAHNKTLAAQLCSEFREFFPNNAVEYFVSYYDYYQPEAYVPSTDTYIEKDASINEEIDRLRLSATASLLERRDVIVVASVSCIYGLGGPDDFMNLMVNLTTGAEWPIDTLLHKLIDIRYERNDVAFARNMFRVRGDTVEIWPAYWKDRAVRVEFFGDEIDRLSIIDPVSGKMERQVISIPIWPASHYVTTHEKMERAVKEIRRECDERVQYFRERGKLIEAQRIGERVHYDIEMLTELGYCSGIENYSRIISGRPVGSAPMTLLDYFPDDFVLFVDESHATLPQVRAMYNGDHARKASLIDYGFRLPSAFDNRPLKFEEFEQRIHQAVYVSATPGPFERERADSVTELDCCSDSVHDNVTCCVLSAEALSVTGSARLTVTGQGDIPIPIWVDGDILLATDDTVTVNALGSGEFTNCFEYAGEMHIMAPTTLMGAYRDGNDEAGLVYYLEPVLDSDFVIYQMPGSETESGLARELYYSGTPYGVIVESDPGVDTNTVYAYPAHEITVERGGSVLYTSCGIPESGADVCAGDRVTLVAADARTGYEFVGWSFDNSVAPENAIINGRTLTFTMPGRDVRPHAVYSCYAFEAEPPYFVVTDKANSEGILYWRVDTAAPTVHAIELEYLTEDADGNPEWRSFYNYDNDIHDWVGWDMIEDMQTYNNPNNDDYIYRGASLIGRAGASALPRTVDTDACATYRIHFWGNVEYYSQPFTIDFDRGIHVLLSQDRDNTEFSIPADYVGTEYLVDFSKYVYSGLGRMSYSLAFRDISGPIAGSVCEATMFENGMLRFVRNGAHSAIYGIEGGTYITATDEESGRSFTIPFDFGEIYDAEAYGVIVGGRRVTAMNKDDVFGDGTVSYDPETKTLTLDNAYIGEIYNIFSDAELTSGAYAIASVQDLTVKLVGENRIDASRNSFCHSQPYSGRFRGTVVGIGSFVNDAYRPYLTENDAFRVTLTGDGSLAIEIDGLSGEGIHAIGDITIDGPSVSIRAKYSGIGSESGSFTMNAGSLEVEVDERSCVELYDRNARFTVNGGTLHLIGGADADTVSMSAVTYQNADYFQINGGEVILESKGVGRLLSRTIYWDTAIYDVLYSDGRYAYEVAEGAIETLDYLKFLRTWPIWVNGQQFNTSRLTIACGKGTASYDPETNTLSLRNAEITRGVAFQDGPQCAAGIYAKQPVNLELSGVRTRIDLSAREYYQLNGQSYALLDEETEQNRYVYGVYAHDAFDAEELYLGLYGNGNLNITGVRCGLAPYQMPITVEGPNLRITGCEGGIDGDVTAISGSITIEAEYYSIYGLLNTENYSPLYAYGGATKDASILLDWPSVNAAADPNWGYHYPYFRLCQVTYDEAEPELGVIASENSNETTIRINTQALPKGETVKVIVAQYKNGQLIAVRIAEVAPEDTESAILLTFGTDEDATYRIFVLDEQTKPLLEAYDIGG